VSDPNRAAGIPESALPSRTSIWAAAARALGARDPDPTVRNPDWLAERLIGPAERALLAEQRVVQALDQDYDAASTNYEALGPARALLVRTHFIDQKLEQAVRSGARQLVILGAGFDTRAYRLKELLKDLRVFEVDRPATQRYKQQRVRDVVNQIPPNLTYTPFDFRQERVGDALDRVRYDPAAKTFFIWEGVTMYLPENVVRETFQWISTHAAPGSAVVFDFVYHGVIERLANVSIEKIPEGPPKEMFLRWRRLLENEPWQCGLPDQGEREYLKSVGLEARDILSMGGPDSEKRYLTRQDGSVFCALPAGAQAQPQMYWLAEAVIPG
jgi:methyltransferase (TIGR00027 family)